MHLAVILLLSRRSEDRVYNVGMESVQNLHNNGDSDVIHLIVNEEYWLYREMCIG